jgi:hypothetical protein
MQPCFPACVQGNSTCPARYRVLGLRRSQKCLGNAVKRTALVNSLIVAVAVAGFSTAACSKKKEEAKTDWSDAETVMVITNRTGEIDLVLSEESLAMKLSDQKLEEIESEFEDERESGDETGLAADFKTFVLDSVEKMLNQQLIYPLDAINAMNWQDGEIVIDVEGEGFISFSEVSVDGDMALETFREEDALAFIAAFEKLKNAR